MLYPNIGEAEAEAAIELLHSVWKVTSRRNLQHEKLNCFVLYCGSYFVHFEELALTSEFVPHTDALKRFHNPAISDVARVFGISKHRAQKGVSDMRKLLASEPSFEWLNQAELGATNLYRKGLPPAVLHEVKKLAEKQNADIRDDKVSRKSEQKKTTTTCIDFQIPGSERLDQADQAITPQGSAKHGKGAD